MTRPARRAATLLAMSAAVVLAACTTARVTTYHSLAEPPASPASAPTADARTAPQVPGTAPILLYDFALVAVPPQVNVPQFVVRNPDDTLTLLEQQRWAAPLGDEIRSAIAERLARRFKAQVPGQNLPGQRTAERLQVDVRRFESLPGREVRLEAAWSVRTLSEPLLGVRCDSEIRQSVGPGFEALAAGHRAAVQLLADDIGRVMRGLQQGQTACP